MLPGSTFLMSPEGWGALATVVLAAGVVAGGFWALYNHRKASRFEAARWTQGLLHDLYQERFHEIKCVLQYEYRERLEPLLERQNSPGRQSGPPGEVFLLEQLDMFLNYFEYMLYLEEEGHFEGRDGHAVFNYWFELLETEKFVVLRQYIYKGRFKRVIRQLNCDEEGLVAAG